MLLGPVVPVLGALGFPARAVTVKDPLTLPELFPGKLGEGFVTS
jgi:hypothetical protein